MPPNWFVRSTSQRADVDGAVGAALPKEAIDAFQVSTSLISGNCILQKARPIYSWLNICFILLNRCGLRIVFRRRKKMYLQFYIGSFWDMFVILYTIPIIYLCFCTCALSTVHSTVAYRHIDMLRRKRKVKKINNWSLSFIG